jgi:glycosyltransferase involved in cell wall biosynthesis
MKVCIHVQPASRSLGGAEVLAVNVALMLQGKHDVEIVHHREWLDTAQLSAFAGAEFYRITTRYIERRPSYWLSASKNPLDMYREPRRWGREIAGACDALMSITHQLPPFNPSQHGVLFLLFPMSSPVTGWPLATPPNGRRSLRGSLSRTFYHRQYASLWQGYSTRLAISEFAARWARTRWGIDCDVLTPLVDCSTRERPKKDLILALGRFSVSGVSKCQREMAHAFAAAHQLDAWQLVCVGEARTDAERVYAFDVEQAGPNVQASVNASRDEVRDRLAEARIFWHAAGLFENESEHPDRLEHFGMATVEAMANGCVPVVIGRGGQTEVVDDGRSGFLVSTLEEMVARTTELTRDRELWSRMSAAARQRAQQFGAPAFAERFRALVPALS